MLFLSDKHCLDIYKNMKAAGDWTLLNWKKGELTVP